MMTTTLNNTRYGIVTLAFGCAMVYAVRAQTNFTVTTDNSTPTSSYQYFIDGTNNTGVGPGSSLHNCPNLSLPAGATYTFSVTVAGIHPFGIVSTFPGEGATAYSNATPSAQVSGTTTLTLPATNFPTNLWYECKQHFFYGIINISAPATTPPPSNSIISIVVGDTNVTITSSGTTTTYSLVPEFNSNLVNGLWQAVPVFTNTFLSGTNTTTFGRLDQFCGSNVFVRISQRPPE